MDEPENFLERIEKLTMGNKQYKFEAYSFVLAALHHTVSRLEKTRHVTGRELLEGIRDYALEQFGKMTLTVFTYWGITETQDFGNIVFALVDAGVLRKQPEDTIGDFKNVYNFEDVFEKGYHISDEEKDDEPGG